MKLLIKNWFKKHQAQEETISSEQASALLLYEAATADYELEESEKEALLKAFEIGLKQAPAEAEVLFEWAHAKSIASTSLYPFTKTLNANLSVKQKTELMIQLWDIAYADGRLDKYEEHYLRHIADLLYLPHSLFIKAKIAAKESTQLS